MEKIIKFCPRCRSGMIVNQTDEINGYDGIYRCESCKLEIDIEITCYNYDEEECY